MKRLTCLLVAVSALLVSCSRHYYAPALFNNDISYMPKPASFDSTRNALYVSGGLGIGQGADFNNSSVEFGTLELSGGHDLNGANLGYGVFGFAGSLSNSGTITDNTTGTTTGFDPNFTGSKSFGGVGARLSGNLYTQKGNTDFRYLGFEAVYSKEFGDYAAYRKQFYNQPDYYTYPNTRLLTAGLTSEVIWHGRNSNNRYAIRGFAGRTFGSYNRSYRNDYYDDDNTGYTLQTLYFAGSFFIQTKHFFYVAEGSVTPSSLYYFPEFRARIGYRF